MKIIKSLFLLTPVFIGMTCLSTPKAFALSANDCHSGGQYQYCGFGRKCKTCPANCYCPQRTDASTAVCTGWTGLKCEDNTVKSNTGHVEGNGFAGVYACPKDFPLSDEGAKSAAECYTKCGTKIYNKKLHCDKGYFLHYKSNTCYKCEGRDNDASLSKNAICVGGDFYPSCGMNNQGVQECPSGKVPNTARTECVSQCSENQIFQDNKCKDCASGEAPNNDHTKCISASVKCSSNEALINGKCEKCDLGTKPNDDHTDCITDKNSVPAGKYLPKGKSAPVTCKGRENDKYYYCPGGDYVPSKDDDQGIFKCASGEIANEDKTGCSKWVDQGKMQECWILIDNPEKFKECVLD